MTLAPCEDFARVHVTVAERDFGTIGSAYLQPDLLHARFLDAGGAPLASAPSPAGPGISPGAGGTAALELAEAALPYTSGGR
ncbi:hypothetical protein ACIRVK_37610 [Streptomyces sp. NPDC101152]|uniref:hypothetical protein n=1 Tax=Streptomyces sp. NPDC101152 TaxID=3366116 RepID=UPI0037F2EE9E